MSELISVIMPAYNAEKFIGEAIESVLAQTYTHFELIVINDGSKDGTLDIIKKYAAQDDRIKVIDQENKGVPGTLNVGVDAAQAEIIARMDSDDIMFPQRLEVQYNFLKNNPEVTMSSCHAYYINEKGKVTGVQKYPGYDSVAQFKESFKRDHIVIVNHPGFITYKKAILAVGKYRDYPAAEDLDMFTRMAENGEICVIPPDILLKFRIHGSSAMAKTSKSMLTQSMSAWVGEMAKRRQNGEAEVSYEDYLAEQNAKPWLTRMNIKRKQYGMSYYKKSTLDYNSKKYLSFAYHMGMALVLNPQKVFNKAFYRFRNKSQVKSINTQSA
ncbi:MAG: glycosyltransferase [Bacteroidota bacterium]